MKSKITKGEAVVTRDGDRGTVRSVSRGYAYVEFKGGIYPLPVERLARAGGYWIEVAR